MYDSQGSQREEQVLLELDLSPYWYIGFLDFIHRPSF
jgi:hypothetical protein